MTSNTPIKKELLVKVEPKELKEKIDELQRQRAKDGEVMKDLRKQLKDAQKDVREMKLLLDMFKTLPKEQRDKAQLMAAEKKVRITYNTSRITQHLDVRLPKIFCRSRVKGLIEKSYKYHLIIFEK